MADAGFNGTTVTFAGTPITGLRSVRYQGTCARPSVTGAEAATRLHKAGLPNRTVTVTIVGSTSIAKGDTGALAIAWNDGGTKGSMAKAVVIKAPSMSGALDGDNTTTIVFREAK